MRYFRESLLQELKSPWELILNEPVPEVVEFRPADWAEKYFLEAPGSPRMSLPKNFISISIKPFLQN